MVYTDKKHDWIPVVDFDEVIYDIHERICPGFYIRAVRKRNKLEGRCSICSKPIEIYKRMPKGWRVH